MRKRKKKKTLFSIDFSLSKIPFVCRQKDRVSLATRSERETHDITRQVIKKKKWTAKIIIIKKKLSMPYILERHTHNQLIAHVHSLTSHKSRQVATHDYPTLRYHDAVYLKEIIRQPLSAPDSSCSSGSLGGKKKL